MDIDNIFVDQYKNLIYNVIHRSGIRNKDEVDLIFSDIIIRILEHNNYDDTKASLSTWLTLVSRSVIGNYLKLKHSKQDVMDNRNNLPLQYLSGSTDNPPINTLTLLKNEIYRSNLKPLWKSLLIGRFYYGKSNRELASDYNLTYENTRKIVVRAIKKLITDNHNERQSEINKTS